MLADLFDQFSQNMDARINQTFTKKLGQIQSQTAKATQLEEEDGDDDDDYLEESSQSTTTTTRMSFGGSSSEEKEQQVLLWEAYNKTVLESSRHFMHMLTLNRSNPTINRSQLAELRKSIVKEFKRKRLNERHVYRTFVEQFGDTFGTKLARASEPFYEKQRVKFAKQWARFKQSFKMVYYAVKSLLSQKDFLKMIHEEMIFK